MGFPGGASGIESTCKAGDTRDMGSIPGSGRFPGCQIQKLLGDINWIRPHLKLTTADLKPLFDCLKSDPNSSSKQKLTKTTVSSC